jgi:hypothetical protein
VVAALNLVYSNLFGLISLATLSSNSYFLLLVDDMSHYMWLQLLSCKDQASTAIRRFQAVVEVETWKKLNMLCTDHGGGGGGGVHPGGGRSVLR